MLIDVAAAGVAKVECERHLRMPFPDKPGGAEFGEWLLDLLLLDTYLGAKLTSAVNENYDSIDFDALGADLDELSLLEARLTDIPIDPEDAHLVDSYTNYVTSLYRAADLLFRSQDRRPDPSGDR
jgi:hypothetical protein